MKKLDSLHEDIESDVRKPLLAKVLSLLVVIGALFSASLFLVLATADYQSQSVAQSSVRGLMVLVDIPILIACTILTYLHRDIYILNTKKKLDERQKMLRYRAYETSFRVVVAMLFMVFFVVQFVTLTGQEIALHISDARGNDQMLGLFFVVLTLPAIMVSLLSDKKYK